MDIDDFLMERILKPIGKILLIGTAIDAAIEATGGLDALVARYAADFNSPLPSIVPDVIRYGVAIGASNWLAKDIARAPTPPGAPVEKGNSIAGTAGTAAGIYGAYEYGDSVIFGLATAYGVSRFFGPRAYQVVRRGTGSEILARMAKITVGAGGYLLGAGVASAVNNVTSTDYLSGSFVDTARYLWWDHPIESFLISTAIAAVGYGIHKGAQYLHRKPNDFNKGQAVFKRAGEAPVTTAASKRSRKVQVIQVITAATALSLVCAFGIYQLIKKPSARSVPTPQSIQQAFKEAPNDSEVGAKHRAPKAFAPYDATACMDIGAFENPPSSEENPRAFGGVVAGFPIRVIGKEGSDAHITFRNNDQDVTAWVRSSGICPANKLEGPR